MLRKFEGKKVSKFLLIVLLALSAEMIIQEAMAQEAQQYIQTNLVSDIPGLAKVTDTNLVNPWGISHSPTSPWWVSDNGMGISTLYNGTGIPRSLVVTIPPPIGSSGTSTPTGNVFNGGLDFNVTPGNSARFIFVTDDGTISAWNPNVDPINATLKVDNSPEAVYKGVTIAKREDNKNYLYVANFREGMIDVYNTNFNQVEMNKGAFTDDHVPAGYGPFNIQNIDGAIFVAFAKQDAEKHDEVSGPGLGFVDAFDAEGNLMMRLKHGFWMNAPWGITMASSNFGIFSNQILVGNFGSGQIAAFDPEYGNFVSSPN